MSLPVLRIGLIGHGTVGAAFARALEANSERLARRLSGRLRLVQLAVRHPDRHCTLPSGVRVHHDPAALAADPSIDIVVEASGDANAGAWLRRALGRGAAVVSANKLAIASDALLLESLAARDPLLQCEAAVAAAVPIVRALRDSLDGEEIHDLRGVLNGTTTYVLSQIERGQRFADALEDARTQGYAEADASADLSGRDAAAKLAILATLAWRRPIPLTAIATRGIDGNIVDVVRVARRNGARVRLVAEAWHEGRLHLRVEPRILDVGDRLAQAEGVTNVVEVHSTLAGRLTWFGSGAGGAHTASALLGDVLAAARSLAAVQAGRVAA